MECHGNEKNAARILYQFKIAKKDDIEMFIKIGFHEGTINPDNPGVENESPEANEWIDKFLKYVAGLKVQII